MRVASRFPLELGPARTARDVGLAAALALAAGCDAGSLTQPDSFRFGQLGEVRITVESVVQAGVLPEAGSLEEILVWQSGGRWRLSERLFYGGVEGDATLREGNAGAGAYASLITQVNDVQALKLFIPELDPDLDPVCAPGRSRIRFRIWDEIRKEQREWVRCASGSFRTLSSVGAGPGDEATRVAVAAILSRDFALGGNLTYSYTGSLPFRTLDRGEASGTLIEGPRAFREPTPGEPPSWPAFWAAHSGGQPLPTIDWAGEMVIVAAVGEVGEAGDSVEVRRVLQLETETLVEYVRRTPGDFCSPASIRHVPFHFVVAPRSALPVSFADLRTERVSCGS